MKSNTCRHFWLCLAITLVGLALRLKLMEAVLLSGWLDALILDPGHYVAKAQSLATQGFQECGMFFRPPLFIFYLALHFKAFGASFLFPLASQIFLSTLTIPLVYLLALRQSGSRVAPLASLMFAVAGIPIFFSGQFVAVTLFTFLVLSALLLMSGPQNPSPSTLFLAGICGSLAWITRPTMAPVLFIWTLALWFHLKKTNPHKCSQNTSAWMIGLLLPCLPLAWMNSHFYDYPSLLPPVGGYNLFIGNNQEADGKSVWSSKQALEKLNISPYLPPKKNNQAYLKATGIEIRKAPTVFLKRLFKKTYFLMNAHEISSNIDITSFSRLYCPWLLPFYGIGMGWFLPWALLGGMVKKDFNKTSVNSLIFIFAYSSTILLFFINARYRLPLYPFLAIFAAEGLLHGVTVWQSTPLKTRTLQGALLISLFFWCHSSLFQIRNHQDAIPVNCIQAYHLIQSGQKEKAGKLIQIILEQDPRSHDGYQLLSILEQP